MIGTLLRVLVGFALASLAAGLALVLHADTPADIMTRTGGGMDANVLLAVGELALKAGTHIAIFALPFALIVAALAEWQGARSLWLYLIAGIAIAAAGFMAQHASEVSGQQTVLNDYAARAFGLAGTVAGVVYWLVAGRYAGGPVGGAEEVEASERHEAPTKVTRPVVDAEVAAPAAAPAAKPAPKADAAAKPATPGPAGAVKPDAARPAAPAAGKSDTAVATDAAKGEAKKT